MFGHVPQIIEHQCISLTMTAADYHELILYRVYDMGAQFAAIFILASPYGGLGLPKQVKASAMVSLWNDEKPVIYYLCVQMSNKRILNGSFKAERPVLRVENIQIVEQMHRYYPIVFEDEVYASQQAAKLLATQAGRAVLLANPRLRAKIDKYQANTFLPYYIASEDGRDFLAKAADIRSHLEPGHLNQIISIRSQLTEYYPEPVPELEFAPAWYLVTTEDGRKLLRSDPALLEKLENGYREIMPVNISCSVQ
jgi:hypothetical protein